MFARMIERIANRLFEREEITRGIDGYYLTRWILYRGSFCKIFLHRFHRSDSDAPHDHPWPFTSIILWPGYFEAMDGVSRWYGPGSVLRRSALSIHRVIIPEGRGCWTIVVTGKRCREWGFHCPNGFRHHLRFAAILNKKGDGCA